MFTSNENVILIKINSILDAFKTELYSRFIYLFQLKSKKHDQAKRNQPTITEFIFFLKTENSPVLFSN